MLKSCHSSTGVTAAATTVHPALATGDVLLVQQQTEASHVYGGGRIRDAAKPGMNCIKIGLPGKLILSKRKRLREVPFS